MEQMFEVMVEDSFDAAHCLRGYEGNCEKLHGHTYRVQCYIVRSELDQQGMSLDFRSVKKALRDAVSDLDHSFLNDLPDFAVENPTAENLAKLIYLRMAAALEENSATPTRKGRVGVAKVTVWETANSAASYYEEG